MDAALRLDDFALRQKALLDWASTRITVAQAGEVLPYLSASLGQAGRRGVREAWPAHPSTAILLRDPALAAQTVAGLMDLLAGDFADPALGDLEKALLTAHRRLPHAQAWRACREELGAMLRRDWAERRRICLLDRFLLHDGDGLEGADLSSLTVTGIEACDPSIHARPHNLRPVTDARAPHDFLAAALRAGERFDVIYATATSERLSDRALARLLVRASVALRPGGRIVLANLAPGAHPGRWMTRLAGGAPYFRSAKGLAAIGRAQGLRGTTSCGADGSIAFCQLRP